jgi:hypothetical protein
LHSQPITRLLVSSYLTISPLPGVAAMAVIHAIVSIHSWMHASMNIWITAMAAIPGGMFLLHFP